MSEFTHLNRFTRFIVERHRIWERRARGAPAPWTKDPILQTYRFCNVYRELDRVTMWITDHWRKPFADDPHLWFALVVARLVNHPETLVDLALPGRWNRAQFIRTLHRRRTEGVKVFGSAYIVSTNGIAKDKAEYLAERVLDPLWAHREQVRPRSSDRLRDVFERLLEFQGMGTFIAAQVIADLKYTPPLMNAKDWRTFAASGPGSRRGMSYVMGLDRKYHWNEQAWKERLNQLAYEVLPITARAGLPRIHNQDLQNCLCEFSKYRRTQLGTGRPKQKFTPQEDCDGIVQVRGER